MTRFRLIACGVASALFLHSCSEILEPVSLLGGKQDVGTGSVQEDFEIDIKSLTFESARKANEAPYPRWLMLTGIGSSANVSNEANFLDSTIPPLSSAADYLLGIGDELLFTQLNEFVTTATQFPTQPTETGYLLGIGDELLFTQLNEFVTTATQFPTQPIESDYLLGVGDELTLIQLNEVARSLKNIISNTPKASDGMDNVNNGKSQPSESVLKTSGLVGTDGNILLLGLGSVKAENRSLNDIQTEIRNILIRNGLAPSFQIEITGFNSKKAYVTFPNPEKIFGNNMVSITNLPITLKELVINYGLRPSAQDTTIVALTRNGKKFRMTARQMFDKSSPSIVIKDEDQIEIDEVAIGSIASETVVGSRGNILLPSIGSLKAEGRSLAGVQADVTRILIQKGLTPSFQLEITGFKSKKAFVTFPNPEKIFGNNMVSITNLPITLKELVINYGLRPSAQDTTIVTLTRNNQKFRMTAGQIFDKSSPSIVITDGDQIEIDEAVTASIRSETVVGSRGNILIPGLGSFKAERRSLAEVQAAITRSLVQTGLTPSFQLEVTGFESKSFFLTTEAYGNKVIALTNSKLSLKEAILSNMPGDDNSNIQPSDDKLTVVELVRNGVSYRMTLPETLNGRGSNVLVQDGDHIQLKNFKYKPGQVFALSGAGNAKMVPIDPSKRETLADILFTDNGALSNVLARRSEVYLLRGRSPSVAYHLDAQNVSRILVASKTELRPNDIVFVADRPIISFARVLGELSPLQMVLSAISEEAP